MKKFNSFKKQKLQPGDKFGVKGKTYPHYQIVRVVGNAVEYTMHTDTGSKQHKMNINMFLRIKDLEYKGKGQPPVRTV
jgi:hypothetical protein